MEDYKFNYPKLWIKAIDKLIEHYKEQGGRKDSELMRDCSLCNVSRVEMKEGTSQWEKTFCICPWCAFSKRGDECASRPESCKPASNIRRLKGWRKRFEAMIAGG